MLIIEKQINRRIVVELNREEMIDLAHELLTRARKQDREFIGGGSPTVFLGDTSGDPAPGFKFKPGISFRRVKQRGFFRKK